MYLDLTIGYGRYSTTLRASGFWFWLPWYHWKEEKQNYFVSRLGFIEIEARIGRKDK